MENVNYSTEKLVGGNIVSAIKTASIATFYRGQLLGRVDATGVYGAYSTTATYAVLNETDIPVGAPIIVDSAKASSSGTAVLAGGVLYVNDATDQGLAEVARDAIAGLEKVRAVCIENKTLASAGPLAVYITGSEVQSDGLVDASGDKLTITSAIVEACQDGGIIVKEY